MPRMLGADRVVCGVLVAIVVLHGEADGHRLVVEAARFGVLFVVVVRDVMLDSPIADHEDLSRRVHGARVRRAVLLEDHDKGEVTALIGHTTGADTPDNQAVHQIEEDRLARGNVDQSAYNPRPTTAHMTTTHAHTFHS